MSKKSILEGISRVSGAYILQIPVLRTITAEIKSLENPEILAGTYLYCGSANGPGGIRARVIRHLKRDKKAHWHVDRLTIPCGVEAFSVFEAGSECDLVIRLQKLDFVSVPYVKFGSSDCPTCPAHLLQIHQGKGLMDCGFTQPVCLPSPDKLF